MVIYLAHMGLYQSLLHSKITSDESAGVAGALLEGRIPNIASKSFWR